MRHWRGKDFTFLTRNASEVKGSFAKLKQSFSTVLLKEECSLSSRGTG